MELTICARNTCKESIMHPQFVNIRRRAFIEINNPKLYFIASLSDAKDTPCRDENL